MSFGELACRFCYGEEPCPTTPTPATCDKATCPHYKPKDQDVGKAVDDVLAQMKRASW